MLHVPPPLMDRAAMHTAWTYRRGGCSVIERGSRIRPERSHRRNVQKLTWQTSNWVKGFSDDCDSRVSSMTIADVSPGVAIRRVLLLYENVQYREAANFINRLNYATFKAILGELPIDVFVEAIPHSLPILEALYAKVFLSDGLNFSIKLLRPDGVVMQMVRLFAQQDESAKCLREKLDHSHPFVASCKKLLKVIILSEPQMKKILYTRKRALDKAIKGMGQHGLVGTSDDTLMNLHEALKLEFERVIHRYKIAVQKLDELSLTPKQPVTRSISYGPAPIKASHQRQLSLRQDEIQERLIKNKTLLNVVEPTLTNHSLEILLGILQKRIDFDKDVLFQFTQLRKEVKDVNSNAIVAPVLMRFSQGCDHVLELMREFADDDDYSSSDISGYHSDSDSAIALSGSSPFAAGTRGYNILYRSARISSRSSPDSQSIAEKSDSSNRAKHKKDNSSSGSRCSTSPTVTLKNQNGEVNDANGWETNAYRRQVENLHDELAKAQQTIETLQEREKKMKERLAEQAQKMLERGMRFENVSLGEKRPTALIRRYGNLYAQARVDTLDALDSLPELRHADELKSKLLFSVVVLAFRSIQNTITDIKSNVRRILQISEPVCEREMMTDPTARDLEMSVACYLRTTVDRFEIRKNIEEVCTQIWATLYDYPCLKKCDGLLQYVKDCVRLAWGLCNQTPPFFIEYEARIFRRDMHVRFHTSNQESDHIKTYLWPALLEGKNGPCVHKGVVIT